MSLRASTSQTIGPYLRIGLEWMVIEDLAPSAPGQDTHRTPALLQFAAEEAKHIELFVRFRQAFTEGFAGECGFIGPADEIGAAVRAHSPLSLAIFVLGIEWATQRHYLDSVHDDDTLGGRERFPRFGRSHGPVRLYVHCL